MFREGWVEVNGIPSHVLTWGGWIEDEIQSDEVLLCITGNPGVTDFYITFLSTLQSLINIPVWVISFAGCEIPEDRRLKLPSLKRNENLYNLAGQVEHKWEFIKKYGGERKLYLVGHSVGGKIVVELLKRGHLAERLCKAFLVFPTLEHIQHTPNGKMVMGFLQYLISFTLWLTWAFSFLPFKLRRCLVTGYLNLRSCYTIDNNCMRGALKVVNYKSLRGIFFLAMDEMFTIHDLDCDLLNKLGDKVHCYYTKTDGWAPPQHLENMKRLCPQVKAVMLPEHIKHAFVLFGPKEVSHLLAEEILEHKKLTSPER